MKPISFYRYPHPYHPEQFIYVGQAIDPAKRDAQHRAGKVGFGRRFKKQFSGVPLPAMEVGWHESVDDQQEANGPTEILYQSE